MHSHLVTLKQLSQDIIHDGTPLDVFESDHLKEPTFSWNPPIRDTLTAVCKNDIDDQIDFDLDDSDTDCNGLEATDPSAGGDTSSPVDAVIQVSGVPPGLENVALSPVANQNDNTINVFAKINTIAGNFHTMSVNAVIQSGGGAPCMVDVDAITNIDNDTTEVFANTDSSTGSTHRTSVDAVIQVNGSAPSRNNVHAITCSDSTAFVNNGVIVPLVNKKITIIHPVEEVLQAGTQNNNPAHTRLSKITELTLDRLKTKL